MKKDSRKVTEKSFKLNETRSLFYPNDHGDEDKAYEACLHQALEKDIYWDKQLCAWYYYLP